MIKIQKIVAARLCYLLKNNDIRILDYLYINLLIFTIMKHKYTKPAFQFVLIQLNDLCVGSKNAAIPIHIQKLNKREKFKRSYKEGETCDMWTTDF